MSVALAVREEAMFCVSAVEAVDFAARAELEGGCAVTSLTGNADLRVKDRLATFLEEVDQEVDRLQLTEVTVDLRALEFMNSSCFKDFVSWIAAVQARPTERHYSITFRSNPRMHWQRRSLNALCCFASDLVSVQS